MPDATLEMSLQIVRYLGNIGKGYMSMRNMMAIFSTTSLFLFFAGSVSAQIDERHQRLMLMTVKEITEGATENPYDRDAVGHVLLRCSITFTAMAEVLTVTIPQDAPNELRENINQMQTSFNSRSQGLLLDSAAALELSEEAFFALHNEMFSEWGGALVQAGVQMFRNNDPNNDQSIVARAFNYELDICNTIAQRR